MSDEGILESRLILARSIRSRTQWLKDVEKEIANYHPADGDSSNANVFPSSRLNVVKSVVDCIKADLRSLADKLEGSQKTSIKMLIEEVSDVLTSFRITCKEKGILDQDISSIPSECDSEFLGDVLGEDALDFVPISVTAPERQDPSTRLTFLTSLLNDMMNLQELTEDLHKCVKAGGDDLSVLENNIKEALLATDETKAELAHAGEAVSSYRKTCLKVGIIGSILCVIGVGILVHE